MSLAATLSTFRSMAAASAFAVGALFMPIAAQAQSDYPSKTVTLLVAWGAGGATDVVTRVIQPAFSEQLGVDVIIKNVNGAAGTIGTAEAANASADGYTVLFTPAGPLAVQPHLRSLPYDMDSFRPVGRISLTPMLMMVPPESRFTSAEQVIEAAQADPGQVTFGSVGAGSLPHLAILALNDAAGVETKHIPFQGSGDAMKGLLGGTVEVFNDQAQLAPQYELTGLAAWSSERLEDYPDVPTMKELGYDVEMSNWLGVFVPAGTPDDVVEVLNAALNASLESPDVQEQFTNLNVNVAPTTPEEFGDFSQASYDLSRRLLEQAGLLN